MQTVYRTLTTTNGPRRALVVAPDVDEVVGLQTLQELRSGARSPHHEAVIAKLAAAPEPTHIVILRARGADGSGTFRLARDLDDAQLEELGYLLARAQLDAWQDLAKHGVEALARVELRVWELAALRSGTARLREELDGLIRGTDHARAVRARDDHWTLGHALLNFGVGLDTALTELLPQRLEQLQQERSNAAANSPMR